jgi:DUF971 family protein
MNADEPTWPQQVLLHERSGALSLGWADASSALLSGHRLRAACRCAGCEQARRLGAAPAADAGVKLQRISPIGEFGLQLHFSDGHERGIYPWAYLRELATVESPTAARCTEVTR